MKTMKEIQALYNTYTELQNEAYNQRQALGYHLTTGKPNKAYKHLNAELDKYYEVCFALEAVLGIRD